MPYLQRNRNYPSTDELSPHDLRHVTDHFATYGSELMVDGEVIQWGAIEEVEVARAPGVMGAVGWLVKQLTRGGSEERYHVAMYYGFREAVLHDITLEEARYLLNAVAYYAPHPVRYSGPLDIVPITEY